MKESNYFPIGTTVTRSSQSQGFRKSKTGIIREVLHKKVPNYIAHRILLEAQQLCDLICPHFESWVPEIAAWYRENRWKKARLAP